MEGIVAVKRALVVIALAVLAAPVAYNVATSYVGDEDLWRLARSLELTLKDALLQSNYHVPGWKHFRPTQYAAFFLLARLFGRAAWAYHLSFFSVHVLSAVFLYLLTLRLTHNRVCALVAGTLFAFHQANTEILCVLASFHYLLLVFFSILTLFFLARHLDRGRMSDHALSVLWCILGLLSDTPGVILMPFVLLLAELFYPAKLTLRRRIWLYSSYAVPVCVFVFVRRLLVPAPLVGASHIADVSHIIANCRMIVRAVFLPYDTMCHPPYEGVFLAFSVLIGCAYAGAFLPFIRRGGLRNKLFLFSAICFSLYVLSAGNFFGHERMCSMAIPFYALLMASLFCNGYEDTGRLYRFATSALSAMLMLNNYSLLLLRTHDWARAGQINKKVMEIFVRGSDEAAGRKIHTVGFHEVRLWFLRGKPIVGDAGEMYRWCHWWNGKDRALDETYFREWSGYPEILRAYAYGRGVVRDDDLIVALEKRKEYGVYSFAVRADRAENALVGRRKHVKAPRESSPIRVNFQCFNTLSIPMEGFEIDEGRSYQPWRGYGWDGEFIGRDGIWDRWTVVDIDCRSVSEHLRDTYVFTDRGKAIWTIDLDNGPYRVDLGWCDPIFRRGPQRVAIEGKVVASAGPLERDTLFSVENVPVEVRDGNLTMELMPMPPASSAIINYIIIRKGAE